MKALLIKTDGTAIEVHPKNGTHFELEEMQDYVGGYIELVSLKDGREMYINEEGKLDGLLMNEEATIISGLYPHDVIVGDALVGEKQVFCSPEEWEELNL